MVDAWGVGFVNELDYSKEAAATTAFSHAMSARGLTSVTAPEVLPSLSSAHVLTTKWVDGERLAASAADDVPRLCAVALGGSGVGQRLFARQGSRGLLGDGPGELKGGLSGVDADTEPVLGWCAWLPAGLTGEDADDRVTGGGAVSAGVPRARRAGAQAQEAERKQPVDQ